MNQDATPDWRTAITLPNQNNTTFPIDPEQMVFVVAEVQRSVE